MSLFPLSILYEYLKNTTKPEGYDLTNLIRHIMYIHQLLYECIQTFQKVESYSIHFLSYFIIIYFKYFLFKS